MKEYERLDALYQRDQVIGVPYPETDTNVGYKMKKYQVILITKNDNKDKYYIDAKDMDEAYNIASEDAHLKGYKIRCVSEVPASMTLF